jgi:hypothetical protein
VILVPGHITSAKGPRILLFRSSFIARSDFACCCINFCVVSSNLLEKRGPISLTADPYHLVGVITEFVSIFGIQLPAHPSQKITEAACQKYIRFLILYYCLVCWDFQYISAVLSI